MTDAARLEEAIGYRDRLTALLEFRRGIAGTPGIIHLQIISYTEPLTIKCSAGDLLPTIDAEEKMLRNTLEMLGVKVEE